MEAEFIEWLHQRVPGSPAIATGIGDDAAVVHTPGQLAILTSDMLMDGVDFELDRCDMRRVGRKSLAVNISDAAAMACRPVAAIVSLALPQENGRQIAEQFYTGLLPLAEEYSLAIAGGDTNTWDGPLVVSITLWGTPVGRGPVLRSGGQVGDVLLVTGCFGGSILGHHFDFQPRVAEAIWIHERETLNAAIDVSDGLSLDVARLAAASRCGAAIELDRVPVSEAARRLAGRPGERSSALDHALSDGEDFELVLSVPHDSAERLLAAPPLGVPLTRIGRLIPELGLWHGSAGKPLQPLEPRGYQH